MPVVDGVAYDDYEEIDGLRLPVAMPTQEYEPPIVVYRNWCDPAEFLAWVHEEVGTEWTAEHVVEGREALVIDVDPHKSTAVYAAMETPLLEANEALGLDVTYWNNICLNRLEDGGEHAGHSDYMPEAKLFFTLILQDPEEGGDFYFVDTVDTYHAGDLVIFGAFMFHGVPPVTKGTRISLTGWMGGPAIR
jgi:hypothetical protein